MPDTDGLLYPSGMRMGFDELQWLQAEYDTLARSRRLAGLASVGFALRLRPGGTPSDDWRAVDPDNDGSLSIKLDDAGVIGSGGYLYPPEAVFIDPEGYLCRLTATRPDLVDVPNDNTWRTLVVRRVADRYEPGRLSLTAGSAVVNGNNTTFQRYSPRTTLPDGTVVPGTYIYIDAADSSSGNGGTYEVQSITNDLILTLTAAIPGGTEANVAYGVAGKFFAASLIPADPRIHQFSAYEFELISRTVQTSSADLIVCDVKRRDADSTKLQIIDRRHANVTVPITTRPKGALIDLMIKPDVATFPYSPAEPAPVAVATGTAGLGANHNHSAPLRFEDKLLYVYQDNLDLKARWLDPSGVSSNPGGSPVTIDGSGTASQPGVVRLPMTCPDPALMVYGTHLCVYVKDRSLYYRTTTDDGVTWSAETLILDAGAVDAADDVEHPFPVLLRCGRIMVVFAYYDDSADAGAGQWQIRYTYSDDYGGTWTTNSNAGFDAYTPAASGKSARKPAFTQTRDGRLWVCCQYGDTAGGSEELRWWLGESEYSPLIAVAQPWVCAPTIQSAVALDPEIYVTDEDGVVLVGTAWITGGTVSVAAWSVGIAQDTITGVTTNVGRVLNAWILVTVDTASPGSESAYVHLARDRGLIWTTFSITAGTPALAALRTLPRSYDIALAPQP